jgi:hypothetical protein
VGLRGGFSFRRAMASSSFFGFEMRGEERDRQEEALKICFARSPGCGKRNGKTETLGNFLIESFN